MHRREIMTATAKGEGERRRTTTIIDAGSLQACVQIAPSSVFLRSVALATIISISASTGANLDSAGT
jgi:hypothetical protein